MSYTLKTTGESGIGREQYGWKAIYSDGSSLSQYDDETQEFHQFSEIDQSKLHIFQMVNDDDIPHASLIFNPEVMKLIHFYKRYNMNFMSSDVQKFTLYVFGYETANGKVLNVIVPSGEVVTTDDIANLQVS